MITNLLMARLLATRPDLVGVPPKFRFLVMGGLKEVDGCVFFRDMFHHERLDALELHHDRTGYEAAVNKVHIEDYLESDAARELPALAATGIECARSLEARLRSSYPGARFRVIVSAAETGLRTKRNTASLRFHKVREGEEWLAPDLEKYQEAIAVIDIE